MQNIKSTISDPRSILITGASSGIGEALALHYAAPGVRLCLGGRDRARLEAAADSCRARGASVETAIVDVTDQAQMARWIGGADAAGALDLVIANAGISAGTGGGGESMEQARAIFAVNLTGVLNTLAPVFPAMQQRGHGQVALMSSLAGFSAWPSCPAYCASKAAVRIYGEALRSHARFSGVRVNVICPGFVESRMTAVNDFPMPGLMTAQHAAAIIAKGLRDDRPRISFPWPMRLMSMIVAMMPLRLAQNILTKLPEKSANSGHNT